jgi:outer membrane protein
MKLKTVWPALLLLFSLSCAPIALAEESVDQPTATASSYTLNDLYNLALTEAESIKRAQEDVLIAQKDRQRARSVLIPRFTAFGNYSWTDYTHETDPKTVTYESPELDLETNTLAYGVRFDQTFTLNGKELIALAISRENIDKSDYDLKTAKETYLFQVASAYFNVLRSHKSWEIAKASVKRLEKHRDAVSARLKLEDVTKTDMYRAESELSDAQSQLIGDKNKYIYARAGLVSLVNLPVNFELQEPPDTVKETAIPTIETLVESGISMRTEIKSAEKQQIVTEKNVKLSKGEYWPTLSLEGQYGKQDDKYSKDLDYDKDSTAFELGAKVTFTLFDGGLRGAEISQALARDRQARLALDETRKKIKLDIEEAYLELITQKGRLVSLNDKLSFSQQNYLAVSEQFKHGLSNSVDMMDANTILVAAERELSDARFGYKLALLKLKRATGSFLNETIEHLTRK